MKRFCFLASTMVLEAGLLRCSIDHGLSPAQSGIVVDIQFQGTWIDSSDVRAFASILDSPTDSGDVVFGKPVPAGVVTYRDTLRVAPGTYRRVGVLWRRIGQGWDFSKELGIYRSPRDTTRPATITVSDNHSLVQGITVTADFGVVYAQRSKINGTITFVGRWPTRSEIDYTPTPLFRNEPPAIRVVVLVQKPATFLQYATSISAVSDTVPVGVSTHPYEVTVNPGTYGYIIVVWKKPGNAFDPNSWRIVGVYTDPADSTKLGRVTVALGQKATGIDIRADFDHPRPP